MDTRVAADLAADLARPTSREASAGRGTHGEWDGLLRSPLSLRVPQGPFERRAAASVQDMSAELVAVVACALERVNYGPSWHGREAGWSREWRETQRQMVERYKRTILPWLADELGVRTLDDLRPLVRPLRQKRSAAALRPLGAYNTSATNHRFVRYNETARVPLEKDDVFPAAVACVAAAVCADKLGNVDLSQPAYVDEVTRYLTGKA